MTGPADPVRLFVAAPVGPDVAGALDAGLVPVRARFPDLRWTARDRWHVTLAFPGETDPDLVPGLGEALGRAVGGRPAVAVRLAGAAGSNRAGVLWVELEATDELTRLGRAVAGACAEAGAPTEERPFRPHLTLARVRGRGRIPRAAVEAVPVGEPRSWTIDEVVLFRSVLESGPARHEPIATVALDGRDLSAG